MLHPKDELQQETSAGRRKNKWTKDRLFEILYLEMQRLKGMKKCIKPTGLKGPSQEHNITQWELWEANRKKKVYKEITAKTSLVVQWLRIHLPMQWTRVWPLVQGDPTCHRATKPMCHSYWACALEPESCSHWSLLILEPVLHKKRSHHSEKPAHYNQRVIPTLHN